MTTRNEDIRVSVIFSLLAFIISFGAFGTCINNNLREELGKLEEKLEPKIRMENTLGGKAPEKFYEIEGKRVYLEIDRKPIEQYFIERTKIE